MENLQLFTSKEILEKDDLYDLQDSFSSSHIPFQYQLTEDEYQWANLIKDKYSISEFVLKNTDENKILILDDPDRLGQILLEDGIPNKAVMLSDDTALQKLFFWLSNDPDVAITN